MALDHAAISLMWSDALGRQLEGHAGIVQAEHLVRLVEAYYNVGQEEGLGETTEPGSEWPDSDIPETEDFKDTSIPPTAIAVAEQEAITPRAAWPFPGDADNRPYQVAEAPVETSAPAVQDNTSFDSAP